MEEETLVWDNPGFDRDLGTGRGRKGGGNQTREGRHGLLKELLLAAQHGREAQMSSGGWHTGALSRWTVDSRPGEGGGEGGGKRVQREREAASTG